MSISTIAKLRTIPETIAEEYMKFCQDMAKIEKKPRIYQGMTNAEIEVVNKGKTLEVENRKSEILKSIAKWQTYLENARKDVLRSTNLQLGAREDTDDTNENLLRETREAKEWRRIEPLLQRSREEDISKTVVTLTKEYLEAKNLDGIASLRAEIVPFINRRIESPDLAGILADEAMRHLESEIAESSDEARKAFEVKQELEIGAIQTRTALNYIEYAVNNGETEAIIPGWKKNETMVVNDQEIRPHGVRDMQL